MLIFTKMLCQQFPKMKSPPDFENNGHYYVAMVSSVDAKSFKTHRLMKIIEWYSQQNYIKYNHLTLIVL